MTKDATHTLVVEYLRLAKKWNALRECDGHGGSPGEGLLERMGQIETELKRRGAEDLLR